MTYFSGLVYFKALFKLSFRFRSQFRDRSFFMSGGGGAGGIWETSFKDCMTLPPPLPPISLPRFSHGPLPLEQSFFRMTIAGFHVTSLNFKLQNY